MSYSGAALEFDLTKVSSDINEWPIGWYFARVKGAEMDISKSTNNPMMVIEWELHDENHGTGTLRDYITANSDFGQRKAKALITAINDINPEDIGAFVAENPTVRLTPEYVINQECLVNLGKQPGRNDPTRMFAQVSGIGYAPLSSAETLLTDR